MSRPPLPSEPGELLRQLAQEHVPTSPDDASPERREQLVRGMRDAIEKNAEKRERYRRLRYAGAALVAAAAFALAAGFLMRDHAARPGDVAGLSGVSGTVVLTHDGHGSVVGSGERPLRDGDALQTAAGARAHLKTIKANVNVSESTELRVSRPSAAEERISLRRGRVDVSVDKAIETQRAVVVETPDAEVVVRGTVFDVRVEPHDGNTSTSVHVTRGSVWVLAQGVQVALLSAGQSWSSAGGVQTTSAVPTAAERPAPTPVVAEAPPPVAPPSAVKALPKLASPSHKPGTLAEENRLFAAGVEARNRGDAARAAELFTELLTTYPQSTLREVAQVERFRALKSAGQETRASTEARRYLAEHPDGAARSEARDLALESQK